MATDNDAVTRQSQAVYKSFCRFFTLSTVAVLALLGLMAIFLL
ncbi:MAG: aa3-type cytochrome c oxidase subunit IV [Proteobacteria bacterium]|nr:aa3-type cytochrome c oxidase subunit IV [Pseudomonadota bacterium]